MRRIAAFLALALPLCSAAYAQSSGAVYAFGDSLTDNGNIPALLGGIDYPAPPYYKNHFSNGPVFVEYLPALIGDRFAAVNDYGVGGAFAGDGNLVPLPQLPGTAQEIAGAAAAGLRFTAADTVILWAGSNNYFSIIGNLPAGTTITDPAVQIDIRSVSSYVVSDTANLIRLGAHTLVVLNVPDLGGHAWPDRRRRQPNFHADQPGQQPPRAKRPARPAARNRRQHLPHQCATRHRGDPGQPRAFWHPQHHERMHPHARLRERQPRGAGHLPFLG